MVVYVAPIPGVTRAVTLTAPAGPGLGPEQLECTAQGPDLASAATETVTHQGALAVQQQRGTVSGIMQPRALCQCSWPSELPPPPSLSFTSSQAPLLFPPPLSLPQAPSDPPSPRPFIPSSISSSPSFLPPFSEAVKI
jgi:hypothetical protein